MILRQMAIISVVCLLFFGYFYAKMIMMLKTARFYIILLLFCDIVAGLSLYSLVYYFEPEGLVIWVFYVNAFIFLLGCLAFLFIILFRCFSRGIFFKQMNAALKVASVFSFNIISLIVLQVHGLFNYKAIAVLLFSQIMLSFIIRFIKGR